MSQDIQIQLFDNAKVRYLWDEEKQQYFFSVVDVIQVLTDTNIPRRYWSDLKRKLQAEGSEVYEKIVQLKLPAPDGKMRLTDVATTEQRQRENPQGFQANAQIAQRGGNVAHVAREQLENELGRTVISDKRAVHFITPPDELPLGNIEE